VPITSVPSVNERFVTCESFIQEPGGTPKVLAIGEVGMGNLAAGVILASGADPQAALPREGQHCNVPVDHVYHALY
jgi:hypothetical protein